MTTETSVGRRATRSKGRHAVSYRENDSQSDLSEQESSYEEEERPKRKAPKASANSAKKRRQRNKDRPYVQIEPPAAEDGSRSPENELFRALSSSQADIDDIVLQWINNYTQDETDGSTDSMALLVNLLLRCCGCLQALQPHDLQNLDSAAETIAELAIVFEKQKTHEYPFVSTNKQIKFFRQNVLDFFDVLMEMASERGLLYDKDLRESSGESKFMTSLLTWLLTLSINAVRPLRYVSTTLVLHVQTKLCDIMATVTRELEKIQRQLQNAHKGRNKKVDALNKVLDDYTLQKNTISLYLDDITKTSFVHRSRDVDPMLRQVCIAALSKWMIAYPDMFFVSSYLRYYGRLLSDPVGHVRVEVSKSLLKLYKQFNKFNQAFGHGLRQFTERFKKQLTVMSSKDSDSNVRAQLIAVLGEIFLGGFLSDDEQLIIVAHYITHLENGSGFTKMAEEKINHEYSKFLTLMNGERLEELLAQHESAIEKLQSSSHIDIKTALKLRSLISIITEAAKVDKREDREVPRRQAYPASILFRNLYQLSTYSQTWELILNYYIMDVSTLTLDNEAQTDLSIDSVEIVKEILDLSTDEEKGCLLGFFLGALASIIKKKKVDAEVDDPESVLVKLAEQLPILVDRAFRSEASFKVMLEIWSLLLNKDDERNIFTVFAKTNKIEIYNKITIKILKSFQTCTIQLPNDSVVEVFSGIFSGIFGETSTTDSTTDQFLTADISNQVQDVAIMLNHEAKGFLKSVLLDEDQATLQLKLVENVIGSAQSVAKLNCLSNYVNLADILREDAPDADPLTDVFNRELFSRLDLISVFKAWPQNELANKVLDPLGVILDHILIKVAALLETLTKASDQSSYNIELLLDWVFTTVQNLTRQMSNLEQTTSYLNDQIGNSSSNVSINEMKTLIDTAHSLLTMFGGKLIDLLISLRVFYMKFKADNEFRGFHQYFTGTEISKFVLREIPLELQYVLLGIFLVKEASLGARMKVELEREDEEEVNFESTVEEILVDESRFDSEDEIEEVAEVAKNLQTELKRLKQERQQQEMVWKAEGELCVYALKLYSLVNLGMVNNFLLQRLQLNANKLGGLFLKIVQENDKANSTASKNTHQVGANAVLQPSILEEETTNSIDLTVSM